MSDEFEITPELESTLRRALEDSERLGPSKESHGPYSFSAMNDKPVVVCRSRDEHGRRITNFIELIVSPGIDGLSAAARIAELLGDMDGPILHARSVKPKRGRK